MERVKQQIGTAAVAILIVFLAALICVLYTDSAAAASKTGIVTTTSLNVRSGPGTEYQPTGALTLNDVVTILDETSDRVGGKWYYISYKSGSKGYASADYIVAEDGSSYIYDSSFENKMDNEGFPESYKDYLRALHAKYPEWIFKAAHTDISWNTAVTKESRLGTSLVSSGSPAAWKSKAEGAYDAETGKYIIYDSGGWVCASEEIIKYYLDPRNFLNQVGIFQFLTHSFDSISQTERGLNTLLEGTFMAGELADEPGTTYTEVLMQAGELADVNPYVLASMILVEQGSNGRGNSISGSVSGYEGFYNYFNIGAYSSGGMDAVTRGLWYASQDGSYQRPWDSIRKSITGGAEFYGLNYVRNNKNTLYFKKWNVMNGADNVGQGQYMTNVQGAESEAAALRNGYVSVLDSAMTFVIPVYNNMPETACKLPTQEDTSTITPTVTPSEPETVKKDTQTVTTAYTKYTRKETDKGFNLNAKTSGDGILSYSSNNTEVATVDENGQVKVVGAGTVKITVRAAETDKYEQGEKVCTLTVKALGNDEKAALVKKYTDGLANTKVIKLTATAESKKVKLTWKKSSSGYAVDTYQIWRSLKKSSGFKKIFTSSNATNCYYINTKNITPNTTYWYKVRGVRTVCGETIYTPFTKIQVKTPNA